MKSDNNRFWRQGELYKVIPITEKFCISLRTYYFFNKCSANICCHTALLNEEFQ